MGTISSDVQHDPVMVREIVMWLVETREKRLEESRYIDVTLGGGGHAAAILHADAKAHLLGVDRDRFAIAKARERLAPWNARVMVKEGTFGSLREFLNQNAWQEVDGIVADLGVSSFQISMPERGFSFQKEGPLDMRMDQQQSLTAEAWIASASEEEMAQVFFDYGEERYAKRIARHIALRRKEKPFRDTKDLEDEIARVVPPRARHGRIHPATRTFQAIRIAVNDELGELRRLLEQGPHLLALHGRMAVISYHSLEDRLVKRAFRALVQQGFHLPVRRVIVPSDEEVQRNRRSRSAKLRVLERSA